MGIEENKEIAKKFVEESHTINSTSIEELITDDFQFYALGFGARIVFNKEQTKQILKTNVQMTANSIDYNDIVAENDSVIIRATIQVTQVGEWQGIPPTGKRISLDEVFVFRIDGDKIAEMWVLRSDLSIYQQLGVLPPNAQFIQSYRDSLK